MNNKVISTFQELGFSMKKFDGTSYIFNYEGIKMVYRYYPDDENFLQIGMPLETYHCHEFELYKIANKLNIHLKYVKSCVYGDNMWIIYERYIHEEENLARLIKDIVLYLVKSMHFYVQTMDKTDKNHDAAN